jgi:hypothetical protein
MVVQADGYAKVKSCVSGLSKAALNSISSTMANLQKAEG